MDDKDKKGWDMVWSGVALIMLNSLLSALSITPETFGLSTVPYYVLMCALIAADVALVYHIAHKYFGKKK